MVATALPAFSNPFPADTTLAVPLASTECDESVRTWLAVPTTADFKSSAVKAGCFCLTSAAVPTAIGAEKLVPEAAV